MIDDCAAILHIKGSAFTIHHSCYSGIAIQRDSSRTIGNDITTDVDTSKLSSLICNNAVLGRDMTSCLNRPICSANADVVASRFPQENIIIQSNLINLLPVDFCFFYIDVAAIDNLAMLARFGCGYFACGYVAVFIYNQFAVGSIECAVAVYEERHAAVWICSTYGQVVFCVQYIGLDGVCTGNVA